MELRHLRYFVAVAEEENVTRAAARLHVSQPPLSRQIRDLEEEIGVPLLERRARSVRLTAAGRAFLPEARAVLARAGAAVQAAKAAAELGELHIGYAPSPTAELLPAILRVLHKQAQRLRVRLHDHTTPEMLAGLRERRLHAALMMQPAPRLARGVEFEPLQLLPIRLAVAASHPFARRHRVALDEVLAQPVVAYSRKDYPDYYDFLAKALGPRARGLQIVEECDGGMSLAAAVAAGRGVHFSASLDQVSKNRLRFVELMPAPAPAAVGVAYLRGPLTGVVLTFVETARAVAKL